MKDEDQGSSGWLCNEDAVKVLWCMHIHPPVLPSPCLPFSVAGAVVAQKSASSLGLSSFFILRLNRRPDKLLDN